MAAGTLKMTLMMAFKFMTMNVVAMRFEMKLLSTTVSTMPYNLIASIDTYAIMKKMRPSWNNSFTICEAPRRPMSFTADRIRTVKSKHIE